MRMPIFTVASTPLEPAGHFFVRRARGQVGAVPQRGGGQERSFSARRYGRCINLVAHGYGRQHVGQGDEVIVSQMEHHSNIVPWQVREEKGCPRGRYYAEASELLLEEYEGGFSNERTKIVAVTHASNALNGKSGLRMAYYGAQIRRSCPGRWAQGVPHMSVDVREIGCDFMYSLGMAFAPTGIGVLYGKKTFRCHAALGDRRWYDSAGQL